MSIRRRGQALGQVRVLPFAAETLPTRESAQRLELLSSFFCSGGAVSVLLTRRSARRSTACSDRLKATGGLRPEAVEFYEQRAKVWKPFRGGAGGVDAACVRWRTSSSSGLSAHPRSAQDELQFLKRVLRDATDRGQRVDEAVLELPSDEGFASALGALTVDELHELASWFPETLRDSSSSPVWWALGSAFWFETD